jgi:hypothetical protein
MSDWALYAGARDIGRILLLGAGLFIAGVVGGVYISSYMASSLMVARNGTECVAVDQDRNGQEVGRWKPRNGRCMLRDWRLWHPFGG